MGQDYSKRYNVYGRCYNLIPDLNDIFAKEQLGERDPVSKSFIVFVPKYWSIKTRAIVIKALLAHKDVKELPYDSSYFDVFEDKTASQPSKEILDKLEKLPSYIEDGSKLIYNTTTNQYEIKKIKE
jgi:hypothetical protein